MGISKRVVPGPGRGGMLAMEGQEKETLRDMKIKRMRRPRMNAQG